MNSRCEIKNINDITYFSGRLDETFHKVADQISALGECSFNLKDMTSINSSGVRQWILLMRKMKSANIFLYECPKVFIEQANMVKDFIPTNAKIMSFYVPFYNEKNGTEKSILFSLNQDYTDDKIFPLKSVVDEKGDEMEIDAVESKYFRFIKT